MDAVRDHPLASGLAPVWASEWGEDRYGVFAAFRLAAVTQRLRWIEPGTYMMGSPATEKGRDDDETEHQVTLSHGFWLADTACSQELWQEVMGANPSHFHDAAHLPVEQVSYDDCLDFFARLRTRRPDLDLRLPTEAEREYGCRAGTRTPFSTGEDITIEQANYDGNFPYRGKVKGEYRKRTVPVRSFAPNPWGLHQMHGNVWEWCSDWFGDYPAGPVTDPTGPVDGSSRVFRGGSWNDRARSVRSAYRDRNVPSSRWDLLGFRLVRGQEA